MLLTIKTVAKMQAAMIIHIALQNKNSVGGKNDWVSERDI